MLGVEVFIVLGPQFFFLSELDGVGWFVLLKWTEIWKWLKGILAKVSESSKRVRSTRIRMTYYF